MLRVYPWKSMLVMFLPMSAFVLLNILIQIILVKTKLINRPIFTYANIYNSESFYKSLSGGKRNTKSYSLMMCLDKNTSLKFIYSRSHFNKNIKIWRDYGRANRSILFLFYNNKT